mmetsp:Transcript_17174/g.51384  ORF Transcript_17174/g.51384 Transcript_17174/m.51384 type:complete len:221 (+) Transcript_17174:131-793(+)
MASVLFSPAASMLGLISPAFTGRSRPCMMPNPRASRPLSLQVVNVMKYDPVKQKMVSTHKEKQKVQMTKNGKLKPHKVPMVLGDTVQIIAGRDKGKIGRVMDVIPKYGHIKVEGVNNKRKVFVAPNRAKFPHVMEFPIHHSNAMLYSTKDGIASRIGYRIDESGKKVRYLKKNGEVLPNSLDLGMEMKKILKARLTGEEVTDDDKPVDTDDGKTIDVKAE